MIKKFDAATQPLTGVHLIEASAGTGKTYSMTLLVLRQIVVAGYSIDRILVVTFTDAATSELREKVYQRLEDALLFLEKGAVAMSENDSVLYRELFSAVDTVSAKTRLQQALLQFDRAQIFTIHGFCRRILFENAFEIGLTFGLELKKDSRDFFDTLAKDFWLAYCSAHPPLIIDLFDRHGLGVARLAKLAQLLYSKPSLQVRGAPTSENGVDLYMGAYRKARKLFRECAERLPEVFLQAKGVNGRTYNKKNVPRWVAAATEVFTDESPRALLPKDHGLERFAWSRIADGVTGEIQIEETAFFKAVDGLVRARDRLDAAVESLRYVFAKYVDKMASARREQEGFVFFDDLLLELKKALDGDSGATLKRIVKSRYDAALIDEFQDTDGTQYEVFKALFIDEAIPFFMIGDPKQAIYAFRGGDIFTYMGAAAAVTEQTWSLGINWRSSKDLVRAVNELFSGRNPFLYDAIQYHPVASHPNSDNRFMSDGRPVPGFQFLFCERTEENCSKYKNGDWKQLALSQNIHIERVCQDIRALIAGQTTIDDEVVNAGDIAVLVRSNDQGKTIRDALARVGVLASISKTESVFETVAANELYQILLAIQDNDVALLKTALSTVAFGIKGQALLNLIDDAERIDRWQSAFVGLRQSYNAHGVVAFTNAVLNMETVSGDGGLKARVLKSGEDEYLRDFLQLLAILRRTWFAIQSPFEQLVAQMEKWLQEKPTDEEFTRHLENDEAAVQIVTVHKSKGLQYPVVYLPFLLRETVGDSRKDVLLYHEPSHADTEICDLRVTPDEEAIQLQDREQRAENIRLLYVALTRAKHVCKVVFGAFNGMESSSLVRLLFGSDADAIKRMDDSALLNRLSEFCNTSGALLVRDRDCTRQSEESIIGHQQGLSAEKSELPGELLRNFSPLQFRPFECEWSPPRGGTSFSSLIFSATKADIHTVNHRDDWYLEPEVKKNAISEPGEFEAAYSDYENGFLGMHAEFGRGASFGTLVHDIFETRFQEKTRMAALGVMIEEVLSRHGVKGEVPIDALTAWMSDLFNVPLHKSLALESVLNSGKYVPELEFVMPISPGADFSPQRLSDAMVTDSDGVFAAYASQMSALEFSEFSAYLKGFIDIVFEHNGKYFIADYKTNDLGRCKKDYAREALNDDMARHHYYLQYHLYTLALHRYLALRIPDYSYDKYFGGVYYLYVRGMSSLSDSYGVYFDRPPLARVRALDAWLRKLENQE